MKYIVDIKGNIEGDYEIIGKYEERPKGEWIERPKGEWIETYPIDYRCSLCHGYALDINEYPYRTKFCPHCGAYMRGKKK